MVTVIDRVKNALNAFGRSEDDPIRPDLGSAYGGGWSGYRQDRPRLRIGTERSIISSIYTRMSIDISSVEIRHTRHDADDRYLEDIDSGLNNCLKIEANLDQAASAFRQDIVLSLFGDGAIAVVPVDTTLDPRTTTGYDIKTMRVGQITQWYPNHVRVSLYNERVGMRQEINVEKRYAAIVENPLAPVMNEPNSTLQRLIRKLAMLDSVDEATSSGKLDLIIQLPYVIKSDARRQQAEQRRKDVEFQLKGSQYGIAYTDGTEKVTQLNRPAENQLLAQIEYLTNLLYAQLGITPEVMNGTANEAAMLNYNNRTVEPIMRAITEAMRRTFLTKTARSQGQTIDYFFDPFKLVPMSTLADISDKLSRNEIVSANEFRGFIGLKPSKDPKADKLINSNMPIADTGVPVPGQSAPTDVPSDGAGSVPPAVPDDSALVPDSLGPSDTSSLEAVVDVLAQAYTSFGLPTPTDTEIPPPTGDMDPDVVLASLDDLDKSIDDAFKGLV